MDYKILSIEKAIELLTSNGYELFSQVNFKYGFYHPNKPRQKVIIIPADKYLSAESTLRVYNAINNQ